MTAATSGGAPAGATASPSDPSVAFAVGAATGCAPPRVLQAGSVLSDLAAQRGGVFARHAPLIGSEDLRSQLRTRLLGPRPVLTVDRGLDPGLRQEVLEDADVGSAHPLAQIPFSECDAASICRGYRQHEYS